MNHPQHQVGSSLNQHPSYGGGVGGNSPNSNNRPMMMSAPAGSMMMMGGGSTAATGGSGASGAPRLYNPLDVAVDNLGLLTSSQLMRRHSLPSQQQQQQQHQHQQQQTFQSQQQQVLGPNCEIQYLPVIVQQDRTSSHLGTLAAQQQQQHHHHQQQQQQQFLSQHQPANTTSSFAALQPSSALSSVSEPGSTRLHPAFASLATADQFAPSYYPMSGVPTTSSAAHSTPNVGQQYEQLLRQQIQVAQQEQQLLMLQQQQQQQQRRQQEQQQGQQQAQIVKDVSNYDVVLYEDEDHAKVSKLKQQEPKKQRSHSKGFNLLSTLVKESRYEYWQSPSSEKLLVAKRVVDDVVEEMPTARFLFPLGDPPTYYKVATLEETLRYVCNALDNGKSSALRSMKKGRRAVWMEGVVTPSTTPRTSDQSGERVTRPHDNDVLLGRGKHSSEHIGNVLFRQIVWNLKPEYFVARK